MARLLVALMILGCSVAVALFLGRRQPPRLWLRAPEAQPTNAPVEPVVRAPGETAPRGASLDELVLPEPHEWSSSLCPSGMVWVGGTYCPKPRDDADESARCASDERAVAVCMDRHEYPSQPGVLPAVMLDFRAAEEACKAERKRLCTESEWAFACLSTREVSACNSGRLELRIRTQELAKPERVSAEIAANEGRRPNAENACVNAFGVFDLLGNVQEWVSSEHRAPHVGALKGGRYNQGSIGCSRSIYVSDPWTRYPHTGLRCCADPLAPVPTSP